MQHEGFLIGPFKRIDELLVLAGAEGGDHQGLRLAPREQRGAMRARQHADLGDDRADGGQVARVDAAAGVEDVPAHDLGFQILEHLGHVMLLVDRLQPEREEVRLHRRFGGVDRLVALLLLRNRIGGAEVRFDESEHFLFDRRIVGGYDLARLLRSLFGKADDGVDDRLEMAVAEHDRAEHDLLGQLPRFRFDHQHRVLRAGDHEIEMALPHLVDLRIEHVFIVDEADPRGADRAHEGRARKGEGGGGGDHRDDVGIVFEIVREHGRDHLGVAAPALGEERPDRAIDQARGEGLALARAAFAFEEAAGDAPGRVGFFLVIAGERQEIDAGPRLLFGDDGRKHGRLAIGGEDRAVGLARHATGLEDQLAPRPVDFHAMNIEHC